MSRVKEHRANRVAVHTDFLDINFILSDCFLDIKLYIPTSNAHVYIQPKDPSSLEGTLSEH